MELRFLLISQQRQDFFQVFDLFLLDLLLLGDRFEQLAKLKDEES